MTDSSLLHRLCARQHGRAPYSFAAGRTTQRESRVLLRAYLAACRYAATQQPKAFQLILSLLKGLDARVDRQCEPLYDLKLIWVGSQSNSDRDSVRTNLGSGDELRPNTPTHSSFFYRAVPGYLRGSLN